MTRHPVKSSNVKSVGHDPEKNLLHVEYSDGKVYEYSDVNADEHSRAMNAPSIGAHIHKHIKGKPTRKL